MISNYRFASIALSILFLGTSFAISSLQPKEPANPQNPKTATTKGTFQLPGDNGKLLTTYQLGAKGSELHFTLDSARFDTYFPAPIDMYVAGAKERLLILNFTVQNPLNRDQKLASSSFQFTAISPDDENFEFRGYLLHATKKTHLDQTLKPAQKVKCTVVMAIYTEGPVSKLMVQRGSGAVLRYDLTGKVGKFVSVFTRNGIDLLDSGTTLQKFDNGALMGPFAINFEGMTYTNDAIKGYKPDGGSTYLCIDIAFTNVMMMPAGIGFQYFRPEIVLQGGEKLSWNSDLINRTNDASIGQDVDPAASVAGRYYFKIPAGKVPEICRFTHNPSNRTIGLAIPPY